MPSRQDELIHVLRTVYDPEIPVNIYDIGLIYGLEEKDGAVTVRMTLTSPMCPVAESLPVEARNRLLELPWIRTVRVDLVWDPPWTPDRMSEEARLELGMF